MAGVVGVDPSNMTMRELNWMSAARIDQEWNHTAELEALLANINRDPKKRSQPWSSDDFHPIRAAKKAARETVDADITILRDVFCGPQ